MVSAEVHAEIKRKLIHGGLTGTIAPLIVAVFANTIVTRLLGIALFSVFLALFALLEVSLRTGRNWNIPFATKAYKIMANGYELKNKTMLGGLFICLSGLILVSFLELHAALVGILVLSFADSAASIAGKAFPKHQIWYNRGKHWEGTVSFGLVSFVLAVCVLAFVPVAFPKIVFAAVTIAVVSAFVESLPMMFYFDNLTVPFCAALLAEIFILM